MQIDDSPAAAGPHLAILEQGNRADRCYMGMQQRAIAEWHASGGQFVPGSTGFFRFRLRKKVTKVTDPKNVAQANDLIGNCWLPEKGNIW